MLERFWAKVDTSGGPDACWLWTGARTRGHGELTVGIQGGRLMMEAAHRLAYQLHHREQIPPGLTIDHLCRVRHCVNPRHLEVVTLRENTLRGEGRAAQNARLVACRRGHPFDAANTLRSGGRRVCRVCKQRRERARRATLRQCRIDATGGRPLHGPPRG